MIWDSRSGFRAQIDKTCPVVNPTVSSFIFAHLSLSTRSVASLVISMFEFNSVDAGQSADCAHALRHMHVAAIGNRIEFPRRVRL